MIHTGFILYQAQSMNFNFNFQVAIRPKKEKKNVWLYSTDQP